MKECWDYYTYDIAYCIFPKKHMKLSFPLLCFLPKWSPGWDMLNVVKTIVEVYLHNRTDSWQGTSWMQLNLFLTRQYFLFTKYAPIPTTPYRWYYQSNKSLRSMSGFLLKTKLSSATSRWSCTKYFQLSGNKRDHIEFSYLHCWKYTFWKSASCFLCNFNFKWTHRSSFLNYLQGGWLDLLQ